jgi:hypothetical protein
MIWYLGLNRRRARGKEYDEFLEIFVQNVKRIIPYGDVSL